MKPLHTLFLSGWKHWKNILLFFCLSLGFAVAYGMCLEPVMATSIYQPNAVSVTSPPNCSDISGNTLLSIHAPGMTSVNVRCWKQGPGLGADSLVGTITPDENGNGSLIFPGNDYPHGPITVRFNGENAQFHSNYYLQLYNKSGVSWKEGIPPTPPPAADGLSLVFADDFNKPLSISENDPKAVYYDHKPGGGDFGLFHFANYDSPNNPFTQIDTYLRIRANAKTQRDGLLSSIKKDGTGFEVSAPCYFECRLIAPSAPGTWPAFWLMTNYIEANPGRGAGGPADELDVIEAYGGEGPHNPNSKGEYRVTTHFWNQGVLARFWRHASLAVPLRKIGGGSSWWETFHTYGCKITDTDTIYYCDDIEVARDPTGYVSKSQPLFFMINLAIGGNGWPMDLSHCGGVADMYIDYIRVYGAANASPAP
jgi:hypothetical protein